MLSQIVCIQPSNSAVQHLSPSPQLSPSARTRASKQKQLIYGKRGSSVTTSVQTRNLLQQGMKERIFCSESFKARRICS